MGDSELAGPLVRACSCEGEDGDRAPLTEAGSLPVGGALVIQRAPSGSQRRMTKRLFYFSTDEGAVDRNRYVLYRD